ncbi:hypothetical protein [Vacuolonema iberomarrocanum]|uniref:hypothetical protein n=1 Tax=Vacuolonema iberomarrocanum TaxID=3454632 RepID=UPI0019F8FAC9|nr:hypothetical protein [filamentous cyanobacterium LEGE 07170]
MKFPESCHATNRTLQSGLFQAPQPVETLDSTTLTHLFATVPPERCGIDGSYDYFGLRNRVMHTFERRFGAMNLGDIKLSQRGTVIVLQGQFCDVYLIYELIAIALRTEGTEGVEINGVTVFKSSDICMTYR